jgi:hypothetical protein
MEVRSENGEVRSSDADAKRIMQNAKCRISDRICLKQYYLWARNVKHTESFFFDRSTILHSALNNACG